MDTETLSNAAPIDCACVIHSDGYSWEYVDRLYNMLSRNLSRPIRFHVFTEADRQVPDHMIKHVLTEWPDISGPKKSWWYKMQLFNSKLFNGQLLYFDLDVVITGNLDWITELPPRAFWAIHDFKRLWKKNSRTINSSVMYFNTDTFHYIWKKFQQQSLTHVVSNYKGDQDFITEAVDPGHLRYFALDRIVSWRWQIINNGAITRKSLNKPQTAPIRIPQNACVLVFHGHPKPHEITDSVITNCWI